MTMPTQEAQRSRETASQAERAWWVSRVDRIRRDLQLAFDGGVWLTVVELQEFSNRLDTLIAERTK